MSECFPCFNSSDDSGPYEAFHEHEGHEEMKGVVDEEQGQVLAADPNAVQGIDQAAHPLIEENIYDRVLWPSVYLLSIGWAVISTMHGFYNLFAKDDNVEDGKWLRKLFSNPGLSTGASLFALCSGVLNYYIAKNNLPKTFENLGCKRRIETLERILEKKEEDIEDEAAAEAAVGSCKKRSVKGSGIFIGLLAAMMSAIVNIYDNEGVANAIWKDNSFVFGTCMVFALASTVVTGCTRINGGIGLIETFADEEKRNEFFDVSTTTKKAYMFLTVLLVVAVAPLFFIKTEEFIDNYLNKSGALDEGWLILIKYTLCFLGMVGNMGFYFDSIRKLPERLNKFTEKLNQIQRDYGTEVFKLIIMGGVIAMALTSGFSMGDLANTIIDKGQLSLFGFFGGILGAHPEGVTYLSLFTLAAHFSVAIINLGATLEIWTNENMAFPEWAIDVMHDIDDWINETIAYFQPCTDSINETCQYMSSFCSNMFFNPQAEQYAGLGRDSDALSLHGYTDDLENPLLNP